ncbi:MAG TPA: ATP-dependent DNA helicase RecG [Chloroflexota bacterium]|nr:ATP-dependent DNA helicase RecG [Chloroflexota bacterium]
MNVSIVDTGAARAAIALAKRVLDTELRRGCDNRAVYGGLTGFIANWSASHAQDQTGTGVMADFTNGLLDIVAGYADLGPPERRRAVSAALELLRSVRLTDEESWGGREQSRQGPAASTSLAIKHQPAPPARALTRRLAEPPLLAATPLTEVKGVGQVRARSLERLGLRVAGDLLEHFPTRYIFYPPPKPAIDLFFQRLASFEGVVRSVSVAPLQKQLKRITARIADSTGSVEAVWLRSGPARAPVHEGQRVALSGAIVSQGRQIVFQNPDVEPADSPPLHTRRIVPVYGLTKGIYDNWMRTLVARAVRTLAPTIDDPLPASARRKLDLQPRREAIAAVHLPPDQRALEAARRRLAFDELLTVQLVVLQRRRRAQEGGAIPVPGQRKAFAALAEAQPFTLTGGQQRVIAEITGDLERDVPMTRLLQGEVGSGKTAVAAFVLLAAAVSGGQGALMAPTEILAEQHLENLQAFFERARASLESLELSPPSVDLITGSMGARKKKAAMSRAESGETKILVGTHALIQDRVEFQDLRLAIIDEQHRFGVQQRITLRAKGRQPHVLLMTATPIPRTLALSLYGDLDVSMIDEMPPGRQVVETILLGPDRRQEAYEHMRQEAASGRQSFVICPLVEDSAALEARSATAEYERLQADELSGLRLGLLHGRMRSADKDAIMRSFRDHELDVLVSTAVVEVGVDVPNATIMAIEGAERFGLAQLHQFRGRVGRGADRATCYLLTEKPDPEAVERLAVVARSGNGLELAEHDLRLRGPGDYFGVRQSGFPELKVATLNDAGLVELARATAQDILARDPDLSRSEHALLSHQVAEFLERAAAPN